MGNLLLSLPLFLIYVLMVPFFADSIKSSPSVFYLSAFFIPIYFVEAGLNAVINSKFPHRLAYKTPVVDLSKLALILWLGQLGLSGVVLCIIIAYCLYLCFAFYPVKAFMKDGFDLSILKGWLSSSWIVLYGAVGGSVYGTLDILLLGVLSSASSLGSYGVASTIAGFLKLSGSLSYALYSKLLAEEKEVRREAYAKEAMMLTLMFLLPLFVGCILLAPNLIEIFGSKYLDCLQTLYILAFATFLGVLSGIASAVILGAEKMDLERFSMSQLARSNIFFINSLGYLAIAITTPLLFLFIPRYGMVGCATAILIQSALYFLIVSYKAFRRTRIVSYTRFLKFLLASSIMSIFIRLVYATGTIETLLIILLGALIYFVSLSLIDNGTRNLAKKIFDEIKNLRPFTQTRTEK